MTSLSVIFFILISIAPEHQVYTHYHPDDLFLVNKLRFFKHPFFFKCIKKKAYFIFVHCEGQSESKQNVQTI